MSWWGSVVALLKPKSIIGNVILCHHRCNSAFDVWVVMRLSCVGNVSLEDNSIALVAKFQPTRTSIS